MAYWWVSQNKTFKPARKGGFLWAPIKDKGKKTPHHWATMTRVQPGDLIFSFVRQGIRAISVAKTFAIKSNRPPELSPGADWQNDGYRIEVDYRDISPPLDVPPIASDLQALLPEQYSPLTSDKTGTQGYLFAIPPAAGRFLLDHIDADQHKAGSQSVDTQIEIGIASSGLSQTTKTALIECRIGQGQFRKDLIKFWHGCCAVTGISLLQILRASHIKPWRDSNNVERLAVMNGLLLSPIYDATFDQGLISFDVEGRIVFSPALSQSDIRVLNIDPGAKLSKIDRGHIPYLIHHNTEVLKR